MPFMGQPKTHTLARLVQHINAETTLRLFPSGVAAENVDDFLKDVDVYVDGLNFFALPARRMVLPNGARKASRP